MLASEATNEYALRASRIMELGERVERLLLSPEAELWRVPRAAFGTAIERREVWAIRFVSEAARVLARRLLDTEQQLLPLLAAGGPGSERIAELERLRARLLSQWTF